MKNTIKETNAIHENFKLGQGYASSENTADARQHQSRQQYGDNPLPKSGGNYQKGASLQPAEDDTDTNLLETAVGKTPKPKKNSQQLLQKKKN